MERRKEKNALIAMTTESVVDKYRAVLGRCALRKADRLGSKIG